MPCLAPCLDLETDLSDSVTTYVPFQKAVLRRTLVALILSAGLAALETPAFGAVTLKWAGTEGDVAARGGYIAFSTRSVAPTNGDLSGPPELWLGPAANPQRILSAQDPAPSFDSLTITSIANLVVDDDGAVTFSARLSDESEVLYSGTAGALKVLAGHGPAVEGMTGLLTTQLGRVYSVNQNALGVTANDGSLWIHAAGKTTLLGALANSSGAAPPWGDGHAVFGLLTQATTDGAFALQARYGEETERKYGIAIGTSASDITMPIPFSAPDPATHLQPLDPVRDAAGNVVFALAPNESSAISALEFVTGGTQTEIARVGDAAPGVAGKMTSLSGASLSSKGRLVFFAGSTQVACAAERSCGTVYTGTPGHLYPVAASGYELPGTGTGATILWLSLASGINEKGQFVVNAAIPTPNSILMDVGFYLYDPSVGFTRLLDFDQGVPEVESGTITHLMDAMPAGDDQFFLQLMFNKPSVHSTWALATVSGLTAVGTDIALDPSTFVSDGTGGAGTGGAGTGGSRPSTGGATARAGSGGILQNPSGGSPASQASAGGPTTGGEAQGKSGGCGLATASRQNPFMALGLLATAGLLAIRKRQGWRRS